MNKKKKIIFSCIFIIISCLCIFFRPICFYGFSSFLNLVIKKNINASVKFTNFKVRDRKIILKNVSLASPGNFNIRADRIYIKFNFKLLKANVKTDISCDNPHLVFYKNFSFESKYKKNKFFSYFIKINHGLIDLVENDKILKQLEFNYSNSSNSISKLELFFDKEANNKIFFDINNIKETRTISSHLEKAETSHINDILQFFNIEIFKDIKGLAYGMIILDIKENKISRFFANLDLSNFTFINPRTSLKFDFEHLRVESSYPNTNKSECLILKKIKSDYFKETKLRVNFENLCITTNSKSFFSDIGGFFTYNPNLGYKVGIQGKIHNDKNFDFQIDSKAYIKSSFSNWLDLNLSFDDNQTSISLRAKEVEDYCNMHVSFKNIQPHVYEAFQDLLNKVCNKINEFKFVSGNANFCLDGRFNQKGFDKIFITDLRLNNFDFQRDKIKGFISKLEGKSSFDLTSNKFWNKFFSDIKIYEAFFDIDNQKIDDLNAKIFTSDGIFQSSSVSCLVNNNQTNAELKGKIDEFNVLMQSKGRLKTYDDNFSSIISCKRKNNNYLFSGSIKISDGQEAIFGFDLDKLFIFNFDDFSKSLLKGWIRAEKILLNKWTEILKINTKINGKANFAAFYRKNKLHLQIKGEDLNYKNEYVDLKISKVGNLNNYVYEGDNYINAYLDEGILSCDVPSFEGTCLLPKFDLIFDLKKAKIAVDDNVLKAELTSVSKNVDLNGFVYFDFSKNYPVLTVDIKDFSSDIPSIQKFFKHFGLSKELDVMGKVKGDSKIITSFDKTTTSNYYINFEFSEGKYKINDKACLENLSAHANYSSSDVFNFSNLRGNLKLDNHKYIISCPVFNKTSDLLDFDLRIEKEICDLLRIKGCLKEKENKYHLFLDKEKTHFFGENINNLELSFDKNFEIDNFKMFLQINVFGFISQMQFLLDLGFVPIDNINLVSIFKNKYSGILDCNFSLDENKNFIFNISSKNLEIFDQKLKDFVIKGLKSEKHITINKIGFDDFDASAVLDMEPKALKIKDCNIKKKDFLLINAEGCYSQNSSTLNTNISDIKVDLKKVMPFLSKYIKIPQKEIDTLLKGNGICSFFFPKNNEKFKFSFDLDFDPTNITIEKIRFYNSSLLNINFSSDKGFLLQGLDFSMYNKDIDLSYLTCKIDKIIYDFEQSKWLLKDTNLYIPANLKASFEKIESIKPLFGLIRISDDIDLTCDVSFLSDFSNINICSKDVSFVLNSKKHVLRDVFFHFNEKNCFLTFDYFHNNCYYTIQSDWKLDKIINGKTAFLEKAANLPDQPLSIKWLINEDKKIQIKEIAGYFCGTDFLFQQDLDNANSNMLFGSIKIDNLKLKKILPKNIEKTINHYLIGKGYELSGRLNLDVLKEKNIIFEGLLSGKDFELLGYQFKTMFSKIYIDSNQIHVNDLKISDQAGIVTLKELNLNKKQDKWLLSIPLLKIKDLRPSLMQKINTPMQELTPFLVRELFLYNFKGDLSSKESFSGYGHLSFINSFKRGHSVFDFPADVLSRIVGIDQALLTPVKGKIDLKVKDGKFYLANLKDSYSESERSKFFLLDKGTKPYIDFDGNIYINIAMKQYVLFKFTESFVISIRGKLENPQCNLKKKRGFLN